MGMKQKDGVRAGPQNVQRGNDGGLLHRKLGVIFFSNPNSSHPQKIRVRCCLGFDPSPALPPVYFALPRTRTSLPRSSRLMYPQTRSPRPRALRPSRRHPPPLRGPVSPSSSTPFPAPRRPASRTAIRQPVAPGGCRWRKGGGSLGCPSEHRSDAHTCGPPGQRNSF